jgi:hypothetical protein
MLIIKLANTSIEEGMLARFICVVFGVSSIRVVCKVYLRSLQGLFT